jgi:hypothetical protein
VQSFTLAGREKFAAEICRYGWYKTKEGRFVHVQKCIVSECKDGNTGFSALCSLYNASSDVLFDWYHKLEPTGGPGLQLLRADALISPVHVLRVNEDCEFGLGGKSCHSNISEDNAGHALYLNPFFLK